MTEHLEINGKSVEEATKKALAQLNVGLDEVEITVLNTGKSGILGIGGEEARIRVELLKSGNIKETSDIKVAKEILDNLLLKMGIISKVEVIIPEAEFNDEGEANPVILNITGDDLGILIGRRGQTLDALQYLVRLITSKETISKTSIMIDVENYKQRRYADLRVLALNIAEQVKASKTSLKLEPMTAFERRIIHLTLANDPDVATESTGEGEFRKVGIVPKYK
jgi:spoIIIJ-associated protein